MQGGRYRLIRRIAAGGMAEVYQARAVGPEGFEKDLCVKRILPHYARDAEFVEMFKNEARLAAKLQHANIVQIFDFGEEDGSYFLAMEYVDGRDLRGWQEAARKQGERLPLGLSAYIIHEAARGLSYAHQKKDGGAPLHIVHRDISPHNLLISRSGEVKVADFGIAKAASRAAATRSGVLKGKVAYMSPEQARAEHVDARSDLFALGIVLHELCTGRRLFQGDTETETLSRILFADIPSVRSVNPEVPEALDAIVAKALQRDRTQRYETAEALARELSRFLFTLPSEEATAAGLAAFCAHLEPALAEATTGTRPASAPGTEPTVSALPAAPRARAVDPTRARSKNTARARPNDAPLENPPLENPPLENAPRRDSPQDDTLAGAATSGTRSGLHGGRSPRRRGGAWLAAALLLVTGGLTATYWALHEDRPAERGPAANAGEPSRAVARVVASAVAPAVAPAPLAIVLPAVAAAAPVAAAPVAAAPVAAAALAAAPVERPLLRSPSAVAKSKERRKSVDSKQAAVHVGARKAPLVAALSPEPAPPPAPASAPAASPAPASEPAPADEPARPREPGLLHVTAIPWAEIFIDGRLVSDMPAAGVPVQPGLRRVRLRNTDRSYDRTFDVRVVPGEKKRFVREVGGT